jgi:hypothetical protein
MVEESLGGVICHQRILLLTLETIVIEEAKAQVGLWHQGIDTSRIERQD